MELQFLLNFPPNPISIYIFAFLCIVFSICIIWNKSKPPNKGKLPPGPWKLPFIGSLHHLLLGSSSLPHHTLANLSKKYGPLMHLQLGEISTVVVSSPEMAKAITKTHDIAFTNKPRLIATDIVFYDRKDIAFCPYGDYWRQMRRICVSELLSGKMVKSFGSIRAEELSKLVFSIASLSRDRVVVNLTERINWFSSSVVCKAAFGRLCNERDQERFIVESTEALTLAAGFEWADFFPSMKWIHYVTGMKSRLLEMHHQLDRICEAIIEDHQVKKLAKVNNKDEDEDIVDVLLRLTEGGELQFPITRDNIKALINDIFTAGTETAAMVAIWAMSEMMKRPSVMAKAQAEVRRVLGGKTTFNDKDLENLTYLTLVIKETFRLHPPTPVIPRESREETRIGQYVIPAKTRVLINVWALGMDPNSWEDPEKFLPKRFKNSSVDFMGNHFEFMPFGAGRRMCPGISFGLANVVYSLAGLLYHFDWELPNGVSREEMDMSETMSLVATKKTDLCLVARPANTLCAL